MAKPEGTVEINVFVPPELRDAVQRKCKSMGTNVSFVVRKYLEEWAADALPISTEMKPPAAKAKRAPKP
jgi:hypothetical protein